MNSNDAFPGCRAGTITSRRAAVERAINVMADALDSPMSLKTLARKTWISPSHLDHVFRQLTGSSPRQFMGALRLQKAKRLLLTTRLKVIDTCLEVGFSSVGTFSYRFAEMVGAAPVQLRKLAESRIHERLEALKVSAPSASAESRPDVSGEVVGPDSFNGSIFIGLFTTPIPQGQPAACAVMSQLGRFTIPDVPDGDYYGFCLAIAFSDDPLAYFDNDAALRASAHPKLIHVEGGEGAAELHFELRPPDLTDPPILVAIPALLASRFTPPGTQSLSDPAT